MKVQDQLLEKAVPFIRECYGELGLSTSEAEARVAEITRSIAHKGYYEHTRQELEHGAKMAWRNSNRCIGRLFWETLTVQDARHVTTEEEMAQALFRHIAMATNDGKIRPLITIFPAKREGGEAPLIHNAQLIRYAGYETERGIVGDPASVRLTARCQALGWRGAGTPFDVLPLLLQMGDRAPKWFVMPGGLVMEVDITHPDMAGFAQLGLRWYAVPIVSNMDLDIGGIRYTAAPFNGWYMGTEIGARNFADEMRYNMLPHVAEVMGLDTRRDASLWKDRALVELNVAVLHSYQKRGVAIVDHHTAARQFKRFEDNEEKAGRGVTGDWTWLIPPVSPATTHIFHQHHNNEIKLPNFFYRDEE